MSETQISHFSLISRLFGNLFFRAPTDPILAGTFDWLRQKGLNQIWALSADSESESALNSLQMNMDLNVLEQEYQKLFGLEGKVPTAISVYGIDPEAFIHFREVHNMPAIEPREKVEHFALLLLTASWLEDNTDSALAQRILFSNFLLPCAARFLTQVETYAVLPFYRALAYLTREILAATADELEEGAE